MRMANNKRYPLQWPLGYKRSTLIKDSRFGDWNNRPSIAKATTKLSAELRRMGVDDFVLSSNLKLRNDGLPRSAQKMPEDKGIAVYFDYKGAKVIASDLYNRCGCNIWAIAKTIEALRGIERWGCSDFLDRAFKGFDALPEKAGDSVNVSAWSFMALTPENTTLPIAARRYRRLAKKYHPDNGGSAEDFKTLNNAYKTIKSYLDNK